MKKISFFTLAAVSCMIMSAQSASAENYMEPATLDYPAGLYASFPPSSVSVTYANQPLELVDPQVNDWGEEYAVAFVKLGEGEELPVSAGVMSSFGDPENPDDEDIWYLDIALYELDDLWGFEGNTVTVIIPEGIVKNSAGDINPQQQFVFELMPTYLDYSINPESGSTLKDDYVVKIDFNHNPIEYLQSGIRAMTYEPVYRDISLELGKEVTISDDNELLIDLSGLDAGYYELVVPEGFVKITQNGEKYLSPDLWLEYTLEKSGESGVSLVEVSGSGEAVYNLQGQKMQHSENLPAGVYIVGGRKVIVRK